MSSTSSSSFLERFFHLSAKNTDVKTELSAGLTTFMAMAYIIFVGPNMLEAAGIPKEAAVASVILTAGFCSLLMGLYANLPIGMAQSMGPNAFFAFYVCGALALPWQTALGTVFIAGIIFLLMTITKFRQHIIDSVPMDLKYAIVVGIGLFIAFIGMQSAGIVVNSDATLVDLGNFTDPKVALALLGLVIVSILMCLKVKAAILIGIVVVAILGMIFGVNKVPSSISDIVTTKIPDVSASFMQIDFKGAFDLALLPVIFTFTVVALFDNIGTTIGVARDANLMDEKGNIENIDKALITDSIGTIFSSIMGTSAVTSFIESSAGTQVGGRTGLTACTVGVLFLLALIFAPLAGLIPGYATAPALIIVGAMMMSNVTKINFSDYTIAIPAFLTIAMMPLSYSIANGFGFGFISYCLLKTFTGKVSEIKPLMWVVAVIFAISFLI